MVSFRNYFREFYLPRNVGIRVPKVKGKTDDVFTNFQLNKYSVQQVNESCLEELATSPLARRGLSTGSRFSGSSQGRSDLSDEVEENLVDVDLRLGGGLEELAREFTG
jgi:hypothetical protein